MKDIAGSDGGLTKQILTLIS